MSRPDDGRARHQAAIIAEGRYVALKSLRAGDCAFC